MTNVGLKKKVGKVAGGASKQEKLTLTSAQLALRPDLVGVDGQLYDLAGFACVHPGGAQIAGAGAYDASALYHSMHAGQLPENSKLLQGFHMGVHERDFSKAGKDVEYCYDSPFAKDVLRAVRGALREVGCKDWHAPLAFWLRCLLIAGLTLYSEWQWILTGGVLWACAVGALHAQIGLSIQHDASHGAVSANPFWNNLLAYGADWIGSSRWMWFQQHILWHHPHTNHADLDPDTSSAEPLVRFHPVGDKSTQRHKWFHEFQHWFVNLVLSLYGPSVLYNPSIVSMQHNDNVPAALGKGPYMSSQKPVAWALRIFYILRVVVLPSWLGLGGQSLLITALLPVTVTGAFLTFVFVVSHNFEGSDRDPHSLETAAAADVKTSSETKKKEPICWYRSQVETSSSYGGMGGMLMTGGLNLQIEHHLFPRLSSWHYPCVRHAVRATCEKHGVRYAYYPYLWDNVVSMLRYVRETGAPPKLHTH